MTTGRPIDAFIEGEVPGKFGQAPALNLAKGGMWGALPDYSTWVNNAPYTQQHGVCRLIRPPGALKLLPNGTNYIRFLKALMEIKSKRWSGLPMNLEFSYDERDLDGSGNMMHTPSDAKRNVVTPAHTWDELKNRPISLFWKDFGPLLIMDPVLKKPRISSLLDLPDLLPSEQSFACLYYDTDITNRHVTGAVIVDNMMPETTGDAYEIKMDKTAEMEGKEVEITFKGFALDNLEVIEAAQELHDETTRTLMDPNRSRAGLEGIDASIAAISEGYKETLETISS